MPSLFTSCIIITSACTKLCAQAWQWQLASQIGCGALRMFWTYSMQPKKCRSVRNLPEAPRGSLKFKRVHYRRPRTLDGTGHSMRYHGRTSSRAADTVRPRDTVSFREHQRAASRASATSTNPAPPGPRVVQRGGARMRSRYCATMDTPTEFGKYSNIGSSFRESPT